MLLLKSLFRLSRRLSTSSHLETTINRVQLMGYVGQNPRVYELKDTNDGDKLVTFSLATKYLKKITQESETSWHHIVVSSEGLQKYVLQRVTKGSLVFLDGVIKYSKKELEDGTTKCYTNIIPHSLKCIDAGEKEEEPVTDISANSDGANEVLTINSHMCT